MSGYLQRIVETAMRSQPRVHPVIRPFFAAEAPAEIPSAPEIFSRASETKLTSREAPAPSPRTAPSPAPPQPRATTLPAPTAPPPDQPPRVETAAFQPLIETQIQQPQRKREPLAVGTPRSKSEPEPESQTPPTAKPVLPSIHRTPEARSEVESSLEAVIQQLTVPAPERRAFAARTARKEFSPQSARSRHAAPVFAPASPDRREPDEIRIDIGRIEVTAVATPVSTAPRRSPKRSLNLTEYLQRPR